MNRLITTLSLVLLALTSSVRAEDALWLDVRTPEEFSAGHLPEAVNIHFRDIGDRLAELPKDKSQRIYTYCSKGVRAEMAKLSLQRQGYTNVVNAGAYDKIRQPAKPAPAQAL